MIYAIPTKNVIRAIKKRTNVFADKECEIIQVELEKLIPLSQYLVSKRLENSQILLDLYIENKIEPYKSIIIEEKGQKKTIAPPVIELRDGLYYICDGMHRIHTAFINNFKTITALLVKNPTLPLPGKALSWSQVHIVTEQKKVPKIFVDYVEEGYTGYSKHLNDTQYSNID